MDRTSVTGKFMRPGCLESENGITEKDSDRPDGPVAVEKASTPERSVLGQGEFQPTHDLGGKVVQEGKDH